MQLHIDFLLLYSWISAASNTNVSFFHDKADWGFTEVPSSYLRVIIPFLSVVNICGADADHITPWLNSTIVGTVIK